MNDVVAPRVEEEKICTSCKEPLPPEMFDESDSSKDGLSLRCRSCETRLARLEEDRESARRKAAEEARGAETKREYVGIRGGLLIAGYVK
jgi:RNase P subunit RPR2